MKVTVQPKESALFGALFLIWVIKENQLGVGILTFQRDVIKIAGQDAWLVVILACLIAHLVAWVMIKTLQRYPSTDLYGIHYDLFGKWMGGLMSTLFILYMSSVATMILTLYIELIQVWLFPTMPTWILASIIFSLVIYALLGGIRLVVGFCFLSFFFSIWILIALSYNFYFVEWRNLLPIMEQGVGPMVKGIYQMIFTILGFEIIYFIYPFVKDKEKVQKFSHIGILSTTGVYLIVIIISITFFSAGEVELPTSPTLRLFKMIQLPFIERLEFVIVFSWMIIILPNLLLYIWAATRGMKRVFSWNQKYSLYLLSVLMIMICSMLETRETIFAVNRFINRCAFYLIFIYPFVLYGLVWFKQTFLGRKDGYHEKDMV